MAVDLVCRGLLVSLFLPLLLFSCVTATDDAFLVVHKRASISKVKSSERVTVSISLHNVGFSTAYDVALNDETWPNEKFNLVSGNMSSSWDKLDAGKSLTHTFVLESKEKGLFYGAPAVVKYRVTAKSILQEAYSTPIHELDVLSEKSSDEKLEMLKVFAVNYGPLISVVLIISLFVYLLVTPSKSKALKAKKKK
ncbi:hypothetical protein KP509_29G009400 [Ceratopteris richardii]|uniref:Translocon-associated protein subunit beta n=1 Tax=Ceratopteris richardii TaxID=49495 RepID=A0A8T2R6S1_CERRI|nr:hypothetical protein KP509_29G009400 [Ceratopteris richardii]